MKILLMDEVGTEEAEFVLLPGYDFIHVEVSYSPSINTTSCYGHRVRDIGAINIEHTNGSTSVG